MLRTSEPEVLADLIVEVEPVRLFRVDPFGLVPKVSWFGDLISRNALASGFRRRNPGKTTGG